MSGKRPQGWRVLGSGPLADEMRAMLAADPDKYAPETWSIHPHAKCPCCSQLVYRCTTRHTAWREGFATHSNVVHTSYSSETKQPDLNGDMFACCCVPPHWGPKHNSQQKKRRRDQ